MTETATIRLNVFDGTRRPINPDLDILVTILDGYKKQFARESLKSPSMNFKVPFSNNLADMYTVIAHADGYVQAGFYPVRVSRDRPRVVDLMLLRKGAKFDLGGASWSKLSASYPDLLRVLSHGAKDEEEAKERYAGLAESQPEAVACLLNVFTAMGSIRLPGGALSRYFRGLRWDGKSIRRDRFYAYCDKELFKQVSQAPDIFKPEFGFQAFHKDATSSYKEVQFGEGNVQLSFYDKDAVPPDLEDCTVVEADIDYYKDLAAHGILEVIPNNFAGPTDPMVAYVLRWIAGRHTDAPPFDPPYVIV